MSKRNPTKDGPEYLVIYPMEGGAWGGHYPTFDVALSVASGRLGLPDPSVFAVIAEAKIEHLGESARAWDVTYEDASFRIVEEH